MVACLQPEECGVGTQAVIEKVQVSSYFIVPRLLRLILGGGTSVGILARIGELFTDEILVRRTGRVLYGFQDFFFRLSHHVVLQARLQ